MKTITFYSYKGGVGRTLALVNIANLLVELGKKVCVLDFDLEAPGLISKFSYYISSPIKQGLVDYIYEFASNKQLPSIRDYFIDIPLKNDKKNLTLIPAGNPDSSHYWQKLSRINWWNLFYEKDSEGIEFFLNLKEQIQNDLNPDYLLIDTRTGITEMSAMTMSILADRVVILSANNDENITGCIRVLDALTQENNDLFGNKKSIHFVLTRIPKEYGDKQMQITIMAEQKISMIKNIIQNNGKELTSSNIIHSDRELEKDELFNNFQRDDLQTASALEYLDLYYSILSQDFTENDRNNYDKYVKYTSLIRKASKNLYSKNAEFQTIISHIIDKYPDYSTPYILLARHYIEIDQFEKAINLCKTALKKKDKTGEAYYYMSLGYFCLKDYQAGWNTIQKLPAIKKDLKTEQLKIEIYHYLYHNKDQDIKNISDLIDTYPFSPQLYNIRASFYRYYQEYDRALQDVYKALEIDTEYNLAYSTLAEIKYDQKDIQEFYRNIDLALKYKFNFKYVIYEEVIDIYKTVIKEERFKNLLQKYQQEDMIEFIENA